MAMELRYAGEFLSKRGVAWRCEILQEVDESFAEVGELEFPADEPLVIDWPERSKAEPLCGSTATLTVISPGDRTYADLYSVKPGTIRLDVYREDELFWSGCLDPEFYEEPYDSAGGYEVTLTFSDFGILDRLRCSLDGSPTIREYLDAALSASGILYAAVDQSMISTSFTDGSSLTLSSLTMRSDNFTDEDGVRSNWADVIAGLLQPLALKLTQREGRIWVYDLNGLHGAAPEEIVWDGIGQSMGTDRVYNEIRVVFSPYGSSELQDGEMDYTDTHGPEWSNITKDPEGVKYEGGSVPSGVTVPECYSFYPDYGTDWDYLNIDFTIFISDTAEASADRGVSCRWFRTEPVLGGEESEGVAVGFYVGHHSMAPTPGQPENVPERKGISLDPNVGGSGKAFATRRVYLPPLPEAQADGIWLRLRQEMLCDCRYNPFSDASDGNEKENQETLTTLANFALVPVRISLWSSAEGGSALKHWTNRDIVAQGRDANYISNLLGDWEDGDASFGDAWLMWCDPTSYDTIDGSSGVGGWKCNRQNFGIPDIEGWASAHGGRSWQLKESFGRMPDGQFVKYPPCGGWLEVEVGTGVFLYTRNTIAAQALLGRRDTFRENVMETFLHKVGIYSTLRWLLFKVPELSVVRKGTPPTDIGDEDIEFSGVLNEYAAEELSLDTICGSLDSPSPTAKGVYCKTADGTQLGALQRAGVTDRPEQLLIGTLYSQYADRRTTLTGEIRTVPGRPGPVTEAAQPAGTKFMAVSERQDCISGCSEVKLCELRPDEYQGKLK